MTRLPYWHRRALNASETGPFGSALAQKNTPSCLHDQPNVWLGLDRAGSLKLARNNAPRHAVMDVQWWPQCTRGQDRHKRRCGRSWSAVGTGRAAGADVRAWPVGVPLVLHTYKGEHEQIGILS